MICSVLQSQLEVEDGAEIQENSDYKIPSSSLLIALCRQLRNNC